MKRFAALALMILMLFSLALAQEEGYAPLPLTGPAPYAPVADALSEDQMSYDDGTISVRVETDVAYDTNVYYVYVTITDPSQLRTATAAGAKSKKRKPVTVMAQENNAVLAINGDFYSYHSEGIIYRSGEMVRMNPRSGRDALIIDENGDFHPIALPKGSKHADMKAAFESFPGEIREAFSFGPALIIDGVVQEFDYKKKTSCGYPTPAQRLAVCQLDALSYLIVATEGPEQEGQVGLNVPQLTELCLQKGARHAYNMDGGNSVTIVLCGQRLNAPDTKNRDVGDIIYFATLQGE